MHYTSLVSMGDLSLSEVIKCCVPFHL